MVVLTATSLRCRHLGEEGGAKKRRSLEQSPLSREAVLGAELFLHRRTSRCFEGRACQPGNRCVFGGGAVRNEQGACVWRTPRVGPNEGTREGCPQHAAVARCWQVCVLWTRALLPQLHLRKPSRDARTVEAAGGSHCRTSCSRGVSQKCTSLCARSLVCRACVRGASTRGS
jgi:hypothetical protein